MDVRSNNTNPKYGKPGDKIQLAGKFYTKDWGNLNMDERETRDPLDESELLEEEEEIEEASITGIVVGSRECEPADEMGNLYGITYNQETKNGNITCIPAGTYIGPMNATVYISGKYGKSVPNKLGDSMSVNSKGQPFMYHTLPEISSVYPNIGSIMGGTHVCIRGKSFDSYPGMTEIKVGNTPCSVRGITKGEVTCLTPAQNLVTSEYLGNRGLIYELWKNTNSDTTLLNKESPNYYFALIDGSRVEGPIFNETSGFTSKLSGLFQAPYTGKISFYLQSSDVAKFAISSDKNPINKRTIIDHSLATDTIEVGKPHSQPVDLIKGNYYFIEASLIHREGNKATPLLALSFWLSKTSQHASNSKWAADELWALYIEYERKIESQRISFIQMPDSESIRYTHAGISGRYDSAPNGNGLEQTILNMLSYDCQYQETFHKYKQDAEDPSYLLPGQIGNRYYFIEDVQPYCGRKVLENVAKLFGGSLETKLNPYLCFAVMGTGYTGSLKLKIRFDDNNDDTLTEWTTFYAWDPIETEWQYVCINLERDLRNSRKNPNSNKISPSSDIVVKEIYFDIDYSSGAYLDEITISSNQVDIKRYPPALQSDNIRLSKIVKKTISNNEFDLEFEPWTCPTEQEQFHLLGVADAEIEELDFDESEYTNLVEMNKAKVEATKEFLETAETATFLSDSWNGGKIVVSRQMRGTKRLKGSYSLSLNNKTLEITNLYPTPKELKTILETEFGLYGVNTYYWSDKCWSYKVPIEFPVGVGGDLPDLVLDDSNITVDKPQSGFMYYASRIWHRQNGGLLVENPGPDFFRQVSEKPQINVFVNGFLASCPSGDCSFGYSESATPQANNIVSTVDPNDSLDILTITGEGFVNELSDYEIGVGDGVCIPFSATDVEIKCKVQKASIGTHDISIVIKSKGIVKTLSTLKHTVNMKIFSNFPTMGSIGGGTTVTVEGSGFPSSIDDFKSTKVYISNVECSVIKTSMTEITCLTHKSAGGDSGEIRIELNDITVSGGTFTYSTLLTASVVSINRETSRTRGGETLHIKGQNFGMLWGKVLIGENECELSSWNNTLVMCILPPNSNGEYDVHVSVPDKGYADIQSINKIKYTFKISNMYPVSGSIIGGTEVTLKGEGFDECNDITIMFGTNYSCNIKNCNSTTILCETERIKKIHLVNNGGRHSKYGVGFAWDNEELHISPGDSVKWQWNFLTASDKMGTSVHETDGFSNKWNRRGFSSGSKTSVGTFFHTFSYPGSFPYSSVPVNEDDIYMRGKIVVTETLEETLAIVKVASGTVIAKYEKDLNIQSSAKECVSSDVSCSDDHKVNGELLFHFKLCRTPVIDNIEVEDGLSSYKNKSIEVYANAVLRFDGKGLFNQGCGFKVKLNGENSCNVLDSSDIYIKCQLLPSAKISSLQKFLMDVSVIGLGFSHFKLDSPELRSLTVLPKITDYVSYQGSLAGGSNFTLRGSGLNPYGGEKTIAIEFGEYPYIKPCDLQSFDYDHITCKVPDFSSEFEDKSVPIQVYLGYAQYQPVLLDPIVYKYAVVDTPTIESISSLEVGTTFLATITGEGFSANTKVYLSTEIESHQRRKRDITLETKLDSTLSLSNTEPQWKCGGSLSGSCAVSFSDNDINSQRKKRSVKSNRVPRKIIDEFCVNNIKTRDCLKVLNIITKRNQEIFIRKQRNVDVTMQKVIVEAAISEITDTTIRIVYPALSSGSFDLFVFVEGKGYAKSVSEYKVQSLLTISSITPSTGSKFGGQTVKIIGNGFHPNTNVYIGNSNCNIRNVSAGEITCETTVCSLDCESVLVSSGGLTQSSAIFKMSDDDTPVIEMVTPNEISGPSLITLEGSNISKNPVVTIGDFECKISKVSESMITCDVESMPSGEYAVVVSTDDGLSNSDKKINVNLIISNIFPTTGGFGGGTIIELSGTGFASETQIRLCSELCTLLKVTINSYQCYTPAQAMTASQKSCPVSILKENIVSEVSFTFIYDETLTPYVTSIYPKRGGTGGGTPIEIRGHGFENTQVSINAVPCDIEIQNSTFIKCFTNSHSGSIKALVQVEVFGKGNAYHENKENSMFYYIDRWSSPWTWGGLGIPRQDEFIIISEGQTILLDVSTPKIKFLLIQGGTLMFDDEQDFIELASEFILIVGGGKLEIGTEAKAYKSKAAITLHGNVRCTELPIFGCKALGIRNGTLDLHGAYIPVTWTHLEQTIHPGNKSIVLKQPVDWKQGDKIVIASTGDSGSMKENEEHIIESISEDGHRINVIDPIKYKHISIVQTFGEHTVETRAEVGLLTRNIKVRGNKNFEFIEELPACEDSFETSMDSRLDNAMTCFSGKFGEEMGTDEMGAIIIISPKYKDMGLVTARIEYTEFNYVGQAFRVGRYPIHFHLPGSMESSYVRGNSIHWSNNRAITLHDTSGLTVEKNVLYNIKGLSIFLEDGVEINNTLQYNLIIFTRMSTSLLNPDVTPGSFWIVNPLNKFRHNACAGSTHSCFWMRPNSIPDGPSFNRAYCPDKVGFGEFRNNTAHSMGQYGFWMFAVNTKVPYDPHDGDVNSGFCNGERAQAIIGSMTTWNCKRGFEIVHGINVRIENQTHLDHSHAGFDILMSGGPLGPKGPGIYNSVLIGHSNVSVETKKEVHCMYMGLSLPENGYTIDNIEFFNFDHPTCMSLFIATAYGYPVLPTRTSNLSFINSPQKVGMMYGKDDEHAAWYQDLDGSLTGTPNSQLMSFSGTHPKDRCSIAPTGLTIPHTGIIPSLDKGKWGHKGVLCDGSLKFHIFRILPYILEPDSLRFTNMTLRNEHGASTRHWGIVRKAWSGYLPQGYINWFTFDGLEHVSNISYTITIQGLNTNGESFIHIGHKLYQQPDGITLFEDGRNSTALSSLPQYNSAVHGNWFMQKRNGELTELIYFASNKETTRKKRETSLDNYLGVDMNKGIKTFKVDIFKCKNEGCSSSIPTLPPVQITHALRWSKEEDWKIIGLTMPGKNDTVIIPEKAWFILDVNVTLKHLFIDGTLEVDRELDIKIEAEAVVVRLGRLIVGHEDKPHLKNFELLLKGTHLTEEVSMSNAPAIGSKALAVFGGLDMHGINIVKSWSKLALTADVNAMEIQIEDYLPWVAGSQIAITSTSYEPAETEYNTIKSISGNTIQLAKPLRFQHRSATESINGQYQNIPLKAEVSLLSRNIKITGEQYEGVDEDLFGARVLVAKAEHDNRALTGSARLSNIEIKNGGQYGWSSNYDPRFSIAFLNIEGAQRSSEIPQHSLVKQCSFNVNYNSAAGFFSSGNITFQGNSILEYINDGITDEGTSNIIDGNLVAYGKTIARIRNIKSLHFYGGINNVKASASIITNNIVSGSSQAGFKTPGIPCTEDNKWYGNEVHSSQHGVHITNKKWYSWKCVEISGFLSWMNWDYGLYALHTDSLHIENCTMINNGAGFVSQTIGPNAATHQFEEKYIHMNNSLIVGTSSDFNCEDEEVLPDYLNAPMEKQRRWQGRLADLRNRYVENTFGYRVHHVGISWPMFMSSWPPEWQAWDEPIVDAGGSYPALRGSLTLNKVTFANFGNKCDGKVGKVVRPPTNDDFNFPIKLSEITFVNVKLEDKILIDRPYKPIHPKDCVDFDCDGFKKLLLVDEDGSFTGDGFPQTIIPDSAYEWDGNPARGLGYHRVPEQMISTKDGKRIDYKEKMPNTGIIRNKNCTWIPEWVAFKCKDLNHKVMIFESLDRDSQFRRLSPLALLGNPGKNGYIDLINGPQDHTCCSGYTCSFRLSTFYTIVATETDYEMVLSSTPPQNMRFHLLDSSPNESVRIKIWFPKKQRLDVYSGESFVFPNNYDFTKGKYSLKPSSDLFIPQMNEVNGANYFDPESSYLHFILKSSSVVNIKTQPVIVLNLGMSVPIENFFEDNIINNIAGLLGIDPSLIRITNIVREGTTGKRKRSTDIVSNVEFEIAPEPASNFDDSSITFVTIPVSSSTSTEDPLNLFTPTTETSTLFTTQYTNITLDYERLTEIQSILANRFQTGEISSLLNLNITGLSMEEPMPPALEPNVTSNSEDRQSIPENSIPYAIQSQINDTIELESLVQMIDYKVPKTIRLRREIQNVKEMTPIVLYPVIEFLDESGYTLTAVGEESEPWKVSASLSSEENGMLLGNIDADVVQGVANFDQLIISQSGTNFQLVFNVTKPDNVQIEGISSNTFSVDSRPVSLKIVSPLGLMPANTSFSLDLVVWDDALEKIVDPSVLENRTWECYVQSNPVLETFVGILSATSSQGNSNFSFPNLKFLEPRANIKLMVMCEGKDGEDFMSATSSVIQVYSFPEMGLLRKSIINFKYKGPYSLVDNIINHFDPSRGSMTCTGCEATKRKKRSLDPMSSVLKNSPLNNY